LDFVAQAESQLQEVKRISPNVAAIIDSEVPNRGSMLAADRQGFFEACKRTGVDCHILERRAFENYLSDRAVKAVKGPKYRALQEFERLRDAQPSWGKDENWRIVRTMTKDEWSNDLGDFISRL